MRRVPASFAFLVASFLLCGIARAQPSEFTPTAFYRLTTSWQGDGKSLDVVNDGTNNKLQLAPTGNRSGQLWKITKI